MKEKILGWIKGGSIIGVFQNKALDSATCGQKLYMGFEPSQESLMTIGKSHAPDTRCGMGWKYLLIAILHSEDELNDFFEKEERA